MHTQKASYHLATDFGGPPLAHQFDDMEQQKASSVFGMWLFLVTEIMFFGGLFATYTVYRYLNYDAFVVASHTLDVGLGTFNTFVLLTSSLTMAMAVHAGHTGNVKKQVGFLIATLILGMAFLGIKLYEYSEKYHHGHMPLLGMTFQPVDVGDGHAEAGITPNDQAIAAAQADPARFAAGQQIFFGLYFTMTGIHAIHMLIGFGILLVLIRTAATGRFTQDYYNPLEIVGLYWHFVDIVWIFLFPLLYLIDRVEV